MNAQKKLLENFSPDKADSGVRISADTNHRLDQLLRLAPRTRVYAVYHNNESATVHEGDLLLLPNASALMLDVFGSRVNAELKNIDLANAQKMLLLGHEVRIKQDDDLGNSHIVTITLYGTKMQAELKLQRLFVERTGI